MSITRIRAIKKMFERGNVSVCGKRGTGKDMLTANVVVRRKKPYISNMNYGGDYIPLDFDKVSISGNIFSDFLDGTLKPYEYPYADGIDMYISDAGVYFPAHYCNDLNKRYKTLPTYFALSRHLGESNCHVNSQALCRVWDKIREQSDQYIVCLKCKVIFGFVIQKIAIFDRYESASNVTPALRLPRPILESRVQRVQRRSAEAMYKAQHGEIRYTWLIYRNKSKYDTRAFKSMLERRTNEN